MRITSKGQVTIPQAVREQAGLLPNTDVDFVVEGDVVTIVKAARAKPPTRGARTVASLQNARRAVRLSTDEILGLTRGEE